MKRPMKAAVSGALPRRKRKGATLGFKVCLPRARCSFYRETGSCRAI